MSDGLEGSVLVSISAFYYANGKGECEDDG